MAARSLSDIAVRHEAKKAPADARPQAPKNQRRIRWNTLRIFRGREQSRCLGIIRRSRTVNVGQAPTHFLFHVHTRVRIFPLLRERILVFPNPSHDEVDDGCHDAV